MPSLSEDLCLRGLVYQSTDPALDALLDRGGLTVYCGFDPTADSLHLGSLIPLITMRRLQLGGHTPIVVVGGATGMVGDPSFKSTERPLLDDESIARNIAGIEKQMRRFLDFETEDRAALLLNNADWTRPVPVLEFLRDVGKYFTVNTMITREAVRARLEDREQGISFTEFSYSLLQAFDFLHLYKTHNCALQVGASDQWGNIVSGIELIRRKLGESAFGLSLPLLTKADGTKFGKSETGTIWLDPGKTSPYAFYQFLLRSEDSMVVQYLKYFTFLPLERIEELASTTSERPKEREAQRALARELTELVHGTEEVVSVERASKALFTEEIAELDEKALSQIFADAPSARFPRDLIGVLPLVDALVETGLCSSKSAARTTIEQGGVSINNVRCNDVDAVIDVDHLLHGSSVVLRRGKKDFAIVRF